MALTYLIVENISLLINYFSYWFFVGLLLDSCTCNRMSLRGSCLSS